MSPNYKDYLATEIISEQNTISYRNVSRALKVHVNEAKCMLYDFYEQEHKRKPGSIFATYLISGRKRLERKTIHTNGATNGTHYDEQDEAALPSSPPPFTSSMLEPSQTDNDNSQDEEYQVPVRSVTLVREESLQDVREQYESITSIHIYSLSPSRIADLVTLTDVSRGLFASDFTKQDPLINNKTYGVISNPTVRRRKGNRPVIPETAPSKFIAVESESKKPTSTTTKPTTLKTSTSSTSLKNEESSTRPGSRDSTSTTNSKQPTLKRDASDLFKAFAKGKTKPALERKDTNGSSNADTSGAEDVKMADDGEGESEDEALFLDTGTRKPATKKRASDVQREKEERAAKLRKMMDSDDEENEAPPAKPQETSTSTKEAKPDKAEDEDDAVAWSDSDTEKEKPKPKAEAEEEFESADQGPKRRRGKRKVMKKRTMKDEDGYLVTKEEAVWESYSEDEPEPAPKAKPKTPFGLSSGKSQSSQKSAANTAKGAAAPKKAGNIMSFFGKK